MRASNPVPCAALLDTKDRLTEITIVCQRDHVGCVGACDRNELEVDDALQVGEHPCGGALLHRRKDFEALAISGARIGDVGGKLGGEGVTDLPCRTEQGRERPAGRIHRYQTVYPVRQAGNACAQHKGFDPCRTLEEIGQHERAVRSARLLDHPGEGASDQVVVVALAAHQQIAARAAVQRVIALGAVELVVTIAANETIMTFCALQGVMSGAAEGRVIAQPAHEGIVARAAVHRVGTVVAGVGLRAGIQAVVTGATDQGIQPGAGDEGVIAVLAVKMIVPRAADQAVVARAARNPVIICTAICGVVAGAAVKAVAARVAEQSVVPVVAGQPILAGLALQGVVTVVARNRVVTQSARKEIVSRAAACQIGAVIKVGCQICGSGIDGVVAVTAV